MRFRSLEERKKDCYNQEHEGDQVVPVEALRLEAERQDEREHNLLTKIHTPMYEIAQKLNVLLMIVIDLQCIVFLTE